MVESCQQQDSSGTNQHTMDPLMAAQRYKLTPTQICDSRNIPVTNILIEDRSDKVYSFENLK